MALFSRGLQILANAGKDLILILKHYSFGIARGQGMSYTKTLLKLIRQHFYAVRISFVNGDGANMLSSPKALERLRKHAIALHAILAKDQKFSYSIIIPVYKPQAKFFEIAVRSALEQSAPLTEVLLGFDGPQPAEVENVVNKLISENSDYASRIKVVRCDRSNGGGISKTTNALAAVAKGKFLLLMDHDDWIRPDLLYRYEQTLRLEDDPENVVLYCNEYHIDERGGTILNSYFWKPYFPPFPYLFINSICHALLVSKKLWEAVGGERTECDGAQDYDLSLRLDVAGAKFKNVPIFLYGWREHRQSTAKNLSNKDYATPAGVLALENYVTQKKLDWDVEAGFSPTTYRGKPRITGVPKIHAVMLYRDNREMTIKCAEKVLEQQGVKVFLTLVDNNSEDLSIGEELKKRGAEIIRIEEGFNFSRLNNRAVKESRYYGRELSDNDGVLFINNDVELDLDALIEMSRWLYQPNIGIIGCRLHYPGGTIQHGGIDLHHCSFAHSMSWCHRDSRTPFEGAGFARIISVTNGVTAACALMQKKIFHEVGGFDEIWYPVAYSDTNLCVKIQQRGLYCLYTPYASGIHYEGASRGVSSIEDFETSRWLHTEVLKRNAHLNNPSCRKDGRIFGAF